MPTQEALKMAGLVECANKRLAALSGGQKQRVYFALALVGNPDVLFLDEPTTGLDVEARRNFWDQINGQINRGKTIILTTHNLEEADTLARRIVVIDHGRIRAEGTPDEIKGRVGSKRVVFRASETLAQLRALTGLELSQLPGNRFEVSTREPESLLAVLFKNGVNLKDLEVVGAGLEEAFLALTSSDKREAAGRRVAQKEG